MISILKSIGEVIVTAVNLVVHIITSFFNFITHIPQYTMFLIQSINILPDVFIPFIVASISIYVIYLLINREAN